MSQLSGQEGFQIQATSWNIGFTLPSTALYRDWTRCETCKDTKNDEEKLRKSGVIGTKTPKALQNAVFLERWN